MKKYDWIKQETDAEIYKLNGTYYTVVWGYATGNETGVHNIFDTDVCVYRWTGEHCRVDELLGVINSDWEAIKGFDYKIGEDGEIDWTDYARKVDEILAQIEESLT